MARIAGSDGEVTRGEIRKVSLSLFAQYGYAAVSMRQIASQVGVRFQQIQKYECGANRMTSSRLYDLAKALNVAVQYFFDGMEGDDLLAANDAERLDGDILSQKETLELVRAYYRLGERPRRRLLDLAKALESDQNDSGAA